MIYEALPAILITGAIAAVLAFALTPVAMRVATALGAIDNPDSGRRIHVRPIPRAGGLAVATFLTLVVVPVMYSTLDPIKRGLAWIVVGW